MGYVEANLLPGEEVLYRAKLHKIVLLVPTAIAGFGFLFWIVSLIGSFSATAPPGANLVSGCFLAVFLVVLLACLLPPLIALRTSEFAVTNKRVLIKVGWLRRHSLELLLQKVEGIG